MGAKQIQTKALVRLLNAVPQPVYVLDDDLTIVFLNQECRKWLGPVAEQLPGVKCIYHVPAGEPSHQTVAAGLCPPPSVADGQDVSAIVSYYDDDHRVKRRRGRFHYLGSSSGDFIGIVAVIDADDLSESETAFETPPPEESQSEQLHEALRCFRQEAAGRFQAEQLAGVSPAAQLARRQVELAACGRSSVLLVGPPGSGRQHLAAVIHYASAAQGAAASPAGGGGLIPLDCSVLGADVILSTIAAILRAALPGENIRQTTLLLNHVDEISPELQTSLALLFSRRPLPFRLISTSRIALGELCSRGQFRGDLAALLSTITIVLPPLVERRDDLPLLAQAFLERCNAKEDKQVGGFTPEAIDQLYAYSWPGNLDELMEIVVQAHKRASTHEIRPDDLPERLRLAAQAAAYPRKAEERIVLDEFLGRVERELIRRALARAKGNKAKAARLLGLTRPRLYRRMVQLGLEAGGKDSGPRAPSES